MLGILKQSQIHLGLFRENNWGRIAEHGTFSEAQKKCNITFNHVHDLLCTPYIWLVKLSELCSHNLRIFVLIMELLFKVS